MSFAVVRRFGFSLSVMLFLSSGLMAQRSYDGNSNAPQAPATVNNNTAKTANFGAINLTRDPSIQYLDDTTAVISWTTNVPASNTVYYGTDRSNLLYTGGDFKDATEHRVHLSNLKPNTRYYFQFDEPSNQPIASFTTVNIGAQPLYDH